MRIFELLQRKPLGFADQPQTQGHGETRLWLRRYEPGDERALDLRGDFASAWDAAGRVLPAGLRWTLFSPEQRPVAIGGLESLRPGVFGAWGLAEDLDLRTWAFVRRAARQVLAYAERELKAREIHAQACATPEAIGLLLQLGFARVGDPWEGPDGAAYVPMLRSF